MTPREYFQRRKNLTHRQRYRKSGIRLRAVGNKYQTSVKLTRIYEVGMDLEMKTSSGRLMAYDQYGRIV